MQPLIGTKQLPQAFVLHQNRSLMELFYPQLTYIPEVIAVLWLHFLVSAFVASNSITFFSLLLSLFQLPTSRQAVLSNQLREIESALELVTSSFKAMVLL